MRHAARRNTYHSAVMRAFGQPTFVPAIRPLRTTLRPELRGNLLLRPGDLRVALLPSTTICHSVVCCTCSRIFTQNA